MGLFTLFRKHRSHSKQAKSLYLSQSVTEVNERDDNPRLLEVLSQPSELDDLVDNYLPTIRVANTYTTHRSNKSRNSVHQYTNRSGISDDHVEPLFSHRSSTSSDRTKSSRSLYATIDDLPHLIRDLQTAATVTSDQVGHSLRRLFALSEYSSSAFTGSSSSTDFESLEETRKQMINEESFIPSLFYFLIRCYNEEKAVRPLIPSADKHLDGRKSSKTMLHPATMYLALLVLNNVCIPSANKRYVAIHCNGVQILCHLLCYDPSCRMIAIVLVNLTFGTNTQFQKDLLFRKTGTNSKDQSSQDTELLSSLAYALRVSSLTKEDYAVRQRLFTSVSLSDLAWNVDPCIVRFNSTSKRQDQLKALLAFDQYISRASPWPAPSHQMFPDTARWCICALHHLTRPLLRHDSANPKESDVSSSTAMALVRTGIVPHLLRCIQVALSVSSPDIERNVKPFPTSFACNIPTLSLEVSDTSQFPVNPITIILSNDPSAWVKETAQDAALFVVMNIAIDPLGRKYLLGHDTDIVSLLATISDSCKVTESVATTPAEVIKDAVHVCRFQCVKARMTLAFLLGSEGHYGQANRRVGQWMYDSINKGRVLMMKDPFEGELLVEMLAHSFYRRSKAGPGGYSGTTFRVKYVTWAIRCLLTQTCNQEMFAGADMEILNSLLVKMLAMRAIQSKSFIDAECAEHACFSLYLLSHFGFHICFLPHTLGKDYDVRSILTKVLIAIQSLPDTTAATNFSARQILFRLRYLLCIDTTASLQASERFAKWNSGNSRFESDGCFIDLSLVRSIRDILVPDKVRSGAQPRPDIFNRPIVRCRRLSSSTSSNDIRTGASSYFTSALRSAYDLSFGSTKVRHLNEATIDDIAIANNIAYCADGKSGVESYGYVWSWDDDNDDVISAVVSPESQVQPRSFPPFIREFSSNCHPTLTTWQWFFSRNWCGSASSPEHKDDINNLGS